MKMKIYFLTISTIISIIGESYAANILFYWAFSGYSHRIAVWPLVEKLVEKGHNVTFFSPTPSKNPNPKVVEVSSAAVLQRMQDSDFLGTRLKGGPQAVEKLWESYFDIMISNCEVVLTDPKTFDFFNNSNYDLIFVNSLLNDCAYGMVYKSKAKFIAYGSTAPYTWWTEAYGYPDENYPELQYHMPIEMTFVQRVFNALRPLYWHYFRYWYAFPRIDALLREKLNLPDMPSVADIEKNASLVLLNSNFIEDYPRSLPPSIVSVPGIHLTANIKPLSQVK
jgi:glucuronosyltransferase